MSNDLPLSRTRNIGIIAHIDAGKTTTTERILFYTGRTHRLGNVDDGTTVTDWMAQERERGITIASAAVTSFWRDHRINIIDTPGHIDFTAEVQRSLRVLDGGVVILDAVHGVQPQSETVWRQADRFRVPRICFINKMDRAGADFWRAISMMTDRLRAVPVAIQVPIGSESSFVGAVDLIEQVALVYGDELGQEPARKPVPADLAELVAAKRQELIEAIVENDDELLERYLNEDELEPQELRRGLRQATLAGHLVPVMCGASLRNKGVQPVLDAIVDYLPSPLDVPPIAGLHADGEKEVLRHADPNEPLAALVFKIVSDPFVGRLAYLRVYSGTLRSNSTAHNSTKARKERIGRLLRMYANHREDVDAIVAGDIAAVGGLKFTFTGDTLCDPSAPVVLESIQFPEPVIYIAIEASNAAEEQKLLAALQALAEEDPTFRYSTDANTGQMLISGMGELHLDILVERLLREFNVKARVGKPQVAYRETLSKRARAVGEFSAQHGAKTLYARVELELAPLPKGEGWRFRSQVGPEVAPHEMVAAVEVALKGAMSGGILAGYPVVDVAATLLSASYVEGESTEAAFGSAAIIAFNRCLQQGEPQLLEPVMKIEVIVPEENAGDVLGGLSARRCAIEGMELQPGGVQSIRGHVPLAETFGYATDLRSNTQGRGSFTIEFDYYAPVPPEVTRRILGDDYMPRVGV